MRGRMPAHPPLPSPHRSRLMNVRNLLIPLLGVGAVGLACGPRSHSEASLVSVNIARRPRPAANTQQKKEQQQVIRVTPSFAVHVEGSTVRFELDVTNVSKKQVELTFPDGQTHDFAVIDSAGREVYRWAEGRMFTQSVQNKTVDAGETLHIVQRATPSLPEGSYVAVATLRSTNFPMHEKVAFELR
jgi:hypothetical protein